MPAVEAVPTAADIDGDSDGSRIILSCHQIQPRPARLPMEAMVAEGEITPIRASHELPIRGGTLTWFAIGVEVGIWRAGLPGPLPDPSSAPPVTASSPVTPAFLAARHSRQCLPGGPARSGVAQPATPYRREDQGLGRDLACAGPER